MIKKFEREIKIKRFVVCFLQEKIVYTLFSAASKLCYALNIEKYISFFLNDGDGIYVVYICVYKNPDKNRAKTDRTERKFSRRVLPEPKCDNSELAWGCLRSSCVDFPYKNEVLSLYEFFFWWKVIGLNWHSHLIRVCFFGKGLSLFYRFWTWQSCAWCNPIISFCSGPYLKLNVSRFFWPSLTDYYENY